MLRLIFEESEYFDEVDESFTNVPGFELELEHSLLSLSKWESFFEKPFLSDYERTDAEVFSYIQMMIVNGNPPEDFVKRLTSTHLEQVNDYIGSKQTATTFGELPQTNSKRGETITSELIYFWMVHFRISFETQTWHLNRLFSLIRIANIKNSKPQKMSPYERAQRNQQLNAERRAKMNSKG